jgi:hypothetical protein
VYIIDLYFLGGDRMNMLVDSYKSLIEALTEFDLVNSGDDQIIEKTIRSIDVLTRVIENRLCELVPEYKAELDNLDK